MPARNSPLRPHRLTCLSMCAVFASLAVPPAIGSVSNDQSEALHLLVRAFDRTSPKNILAIMRMPLRGDNQFQTVQVIVSSDGKQKVTVLQPLQMAGLTILDIGETRQIYNPDRRTLTIGPSPALSLYSATMRGRLVKQNYRLKLTRNVTIAGHSTTCVTAVPRHRELETSKIYVDPTSFFIARVESVDREGKTALRFDTKALSYPAHLPASQFTLQTDSEISTHKETPPAPVRSLGDAQAKTGLVPILPSRLPLGFEMRKMYVRVSAEYTSIGFDLTDGLALATVFELRADACPPSVRDLMRQSQDSYITVGNMVIMIYSDINSAGKRRLLEEFRRAQVKHR